jgi:hypothetical protein
MIRQAPASCAAAAAAERCARASSGSSPRLCLPAAGSRLPCRFSTAAATPWRFTPIQVPPAERSHPATTSGWSCQCAAGGSQARSSISSRLAARISGQAWSGRISRTTVHTVRAYLSAQRIEIAHVARLYGIGVPSMHRSCPPPDMRLQSPWRAIHAWPPPKELTSARSALAGVIRPMRSSAVTSGTGNGLAK